MADRLHVVIIHQSADLYGSDKVLLTLLNGLDKKKYRPILLIPCDGPLVDELKRNDLEFHIVPLVRASRSTFTFKGILNLPGEILESMKSINSVLAGRQVDILYSNTLAVLSGAFFSRWKHIPHVWHVHEIIERPIFARKLFVWMLRMFADHIICNSYATESHLTSDLPSLSIKSTVIWNGQNLITQEYTESVRAFQREFELDKDQVVITLMGRINRWKGQRMLVEAAGILHQNGFKKVHYFIVGSTPKNQEHFLQDLEADIQVSPAQSQISIIPFTNNIWPVWCASDIAVVPSTEPEPFGMVALEAMAASKPVVAAGHGGVAEIVDNEVTGYLVKPGNADLLASALTKLIEDKELRQLMGKAGLERLKEHFTTGQYVSLIQVVFSELYYKKK